MLGAREPGETLFGCDEDRKPRLHDMVKCVLEEADQHLSNNLDRAGELPGTPDILLTEHMNSAIHDHWYPDITANAARRPPIDSLEHAASARLMEVQRGALQRMDELIRLALLNHSAAMCAKDQMHNNSGKECMGPHVFRCVRLRHGPEYTRAGGVAASTHVCSSQSIRTPRPDRCAKERVATADSGPAGAVPPIDTRRDRGNNIGVNQGGVHAPC